MAKACMLRCDVVDIDRAVSSFVEESVQEKAHLLGHFSRGLIAAYIAPGTALCSCLILEESPFFFIRGKAKNTFNYIDLSAICRSFIGQSESKDFVLYCFSNQYLVHKYGQRLCIEVQLDEDIPYGSGFGIKLTFTL